MNEQQFRVNDLVKFNYSEITEYADEEHTPTPLRNDEVCELLNKQQATIKQLEEDYAIAEDYANIFEKENVKLRKQIDEQQATITVLKEENEQLKEDVNDYHNALFDLHKKYDKLEKENVKLRKQIDEQQATISKQLDQIIELQDKYRILEFNHSRLENRNKAQYEKINKLKSELNDCEKFRYSVFKGMEKIIEDKDNCVLNKDAKSPCKAYDECLKRQGTNKPLPCVVNWMMGRPFENMKKEANR